MTELEVQRLVDDPHIPDDNCFRGWVDAALEGAGACMVNLRIVDLAEGCALNREWRSKDSANQGLRFPGDIP